MAFRFACRSLSDPKKPKTAGIFALYALAAGLAGAAVGLSVGLLGARLSGTRVALVVAIALLVFSVVEAIPPLTWAIPQRRAQTRRDWLYIHPVKWALLTGGYLGSGVLTRIGVSAWFLIPGLTLISGSVIVGVMAFAVYGVARVVLTTVLFEGVLDHPRLGRPDWWPDGRLLHKASACIVMSAGMVIIGLLASGRALG
jgi:hypothetical protein